MDIEVSILGPGDANRLRNVAEDVFDDAIDQALCTEFLSDPRHHLAAAFHDDKVIGMASGLHYVHPDKPAELWINEVGVAPGFQSKGVGCRLLHALFALARELGCEEAWVDADADNHGARAFYTALGGDPQATVQYTFELSAEETLQSK